MRVSTYLPIILEGAAVRVFKITQDVTPISKRSNVPNVSKFLSKLRRREKSPGKLLTQCSLLKYY